MFCFYPRCCGCMWKLNYNIGKNSLPNDSLTGGKSQESVTYILIPGRLLETALFSWLIFLAWAKNLNSQLIWGWCGLRQVWSKATFSHIIPAWRENTEQVGRINQGKSCRGIFQYSCSHSRAGVLGSLLYRWHMLWRSAWQ